MTASPINDLREVLARWALKYASAEHYDGDEVGRIGGLVITVRDLRKAYWQHCGTALEPGSIAETLLISQRLRPHGSVVNQKYFGVPA